MGRDFFNDRNGTSWTNIIVFELSCGNPRDMFYLRENPIRRSNYTYLPIHIRTHNILLPFICYMVYIKNQTAIIILIYILYCNIWSIIKNHFLFCSKVLYYYVIMSELNGININTTFSDNRNVNKVSVYCK